MRHPAGQGGGRLQRHADQECHRRRGPNQQRQAGSQFNQRGHGVQSFHEQGTVEHKAIEGTENFFFVGFVGFGSGFIFFASRPWPDAFDFDCQVARARQLRNARAFHKAALKGLAAVAGPPSC